MLNLVKITNNQVTTDSRIIAEAFHKQHSHILRDIQNLDIPEDFRKSNFGLSSFHSGTRDYPMYEITRDGFTLLAMGFTGKKAMEWKIKYINAFNAMEKALTEKNTDKPVLVSEHTRALPSGKKEIVLSEKAKQEIGGIVKAVANKAVEDYFNDRIDEKFMVSMRNWMKEIVTGCIRAEIAPYMLKDGVKQTEAFNGSVTADGLPVANWIVGIIHGANALDSCIKQLKNKQNQAVKLLEN